MGLFGFGREKKAAPESDPAAKPSAQEVNDSFRDKVGEEARKKYDERQLKMVTKELVGIERGDPKYGEILNGIKTKINPIESYLDEVIGSGKSGKALEDIVAQAEKQLENLKKLEVNDETLEVEDALKAIKNKAVSAVGDSIKRA